MPCPKAESHLPKHRASKNLDETKLFSPSPSPPPINTQQCLNTSLPRACGPSEHQSPVEISAAANATRIAPSRAPTCIIASRHCGISALVGLHLQRRQYRGDNTRLCMMGYPLPRSRWLRLSMNPSMCLLRIETSTRHWYNWERISAS